MAGAELKKRDAGAHRYPLATTVMALHAGGLKAYGTDSTVHTDRVR